MSLTAGTRLGRYEIRSKIGEGGMGEVYLAQDTKLDRKVALKILPPDVAENGERMQRFVQEARAASALNHPNIITIYEIDASTSVTEGASVETHFIAGEFIDGETLRQRLRSSIEIDDALDIAIQVASALAAAHRVNIIHRDIKPENIMIRSDDGLVKVVDFGLAKVSEPGAVATGPIDPDAETRVLRANTAPGVVLGTVAYMSPEQARGQSVDERTDIWSLSVVLYEMVTHCQPFAAGTSNEIISAILSKDAPPPLARFAHQVAAELERIVDKSLQKNRDERYQSVKDLLIDLQRLKQSRQVQAAIERSTSPDKSETTSDKPKIVEQVLEQAGALREANGNAAAAITKNVPATSSSLEYAITQARNHKLAVITTGLVLLGVLSTLGYFGFVSKGGSKDQINLIAVMPFVNESGDADVEYLSDGMTETLINTLSQLPNLSIKARSTVFHYKGKDVLPQQVGNELKVQAVLNGRVVQRGDDLVLYLSLVDSKTGNQIWGEQYNRKLTDLVSLQSEIAQDVSNKLRTKLSDADQQKLTKNYTANPEAYQLYLQGRFYWNKRTGEMLKKSIEYFNQAIEKDPSYALAYAGLADAYGLLPIYSDTTPREAMPKAKDAALKALSLDRQLAEAHASLGLVLVGYEHDFVGAEREYLRAIELNPNYATTHNYYGNLFASLGRSENSLAEYRRALEIDPLSLAINRGYGERLALARRYDEAVAQLKKTLELDAGFASAHYSLAAVYQMKSDYVACVEELAKYEELVGQSQLAASMRESYARGGWQGFLRLMIDKRLRFESPWHNLAVFYAALGEKDRALAELNQAYENHDNFILHLKVDSRLDPLRDDPRFQELLRKVGFPE